MEYQEVKCRNCGSPMHVAEGAERIRCPYCGTEYILNSRNRQENSIHVINYGGRGALFQSYLPSGWDYRIFDDNDSISTLAPVIPMISDAISLFRSLSSTRRTLLSE